MSQSKENYSDYRNQLASDLRSKPQEREDILANAQNDPDYYISKYSKREGRQLTLEETYSILSPKFSILSKNRPDSEYNSFFPDLLESSDNFTNLNSKYQKLRDSRDPLQRRLLEVELLEQLPTINELHQTYVSQLLLLRSLYSLAKARFIVADQLYNNLNLELDNLRKLIDEKETLDEDANDLLDKFEEINEKFRGDGGVSDSRFLNEKLLEDIPVLKNLLKKNSSTLISLIDNLNKINSHETNPSQDSILNRVELENIPEGYVSVFHTTNPTALESIDDFGLLTTKQSERIRRTQSYIDQYKNSINSRYINDVENISRANCIYAFLNNDDFESSFGRGKDNILLEIKVDPKNCYVIDFELSTRILQTSMMRT